MASRPGHPFRIRSLQAAYTLVPIAAFQSHNVMPAFVALI